MVKAEGTVEAVLGDIHEQRAAHPGRRMGPRPGALLPDRALQADRCGRHQGEPQLGQLPQALPCARIPQRQCDRLHGHLSTEAVPSSPSPAADM
ncbi:hypothetical protein GCM10009753_26910 [Streptantibioticus ferralitis]